MLVADKENFRFRLSEELKLKWTSLCDAKQISQQRAIELLIDWFSQQDSLMQSMILKQVEAERDLVRTALERLGESASGQNYRRAAKKG